MQKRPSKPSIRRPPTIGVAVKRRARKVPLAGSNKKRAPSNPNHSLLQHVFASARIACGGWGTSTETRHHGNIVLWRIGICMFSFFTYRSAFVPYDHQIDHEPTN